MTTTNLKHRRPWTSEEDDALIYLRDELKIQKWTQISQKMFSMFGLQSRSHKQCRDRYVNFIKNVDNSYIWKIQDDIKLAELYYSMGNKWLDISYYFPKTNGIYIKNKFYSRLRKAIRYVNIIIEAHFCQLQKPFSFDIIFKLVNGINHKNTFNDNAQIKDILELNPKFFQGIIIKLVKMTNDDSSHLMKKRKLHILNHKDEIMWKKMIQILRFLQRQSHYHQHLQKDFHLQTNHHHQGVKNLFALEIQHFLSTDKEYEDLQMQQQKLKQSKQAKYIQLSYNQYIMRKRHNIQIISTLKHIRQKSNQYYLNQTQLQPQDSPFLHEPQLERRIFFASQLKE